MVVRGLVEQRQTHEVLRITLSLVPVFFAAAAILLAFYGNSTSFFQDESFVVWLTKPGLRHFIEYFRYEPHPPLYHSILKIWISLIGDSEQSVRALSGVFYVLALLTIAWLGRSFLRWDELIMVLVLVACSSVLLEAGHFGRMYALVFFESCLALFAFYRLFLTPSAAPVPMAILLGTANLAGMFTHYYFVFLIFAQAIVFLLFVRRNWTTACLALVVPGILFIVLWGTHVIGQLGTERFASDMVVPFGWRQVGAEVFGYYQKRWLLPLTWLTVVLTVSRRNNRWHWRTWHAIRAKLQAATRDRRLQIFAVVWVTTFAGPLLLGAIAGAQFWHGGTTTLPALLPLAIILALVLRRGSPTLNIVAACVVLATTVAAEVRAHNLMYAKDSEHRASIQRLKDEASDGDIIVGLDNYVTLFYYYMRRAPGARQVEILVYPPELGMHPGWYNQAATLKDRRDYVDATREYAAQRARELAARPGRRLWLIDTSWNADTTRIVTEAFDATLRRVESISVAGGTGYSQYIAYEPR